MKLLISIVIGAVLFNGCANDGEGRAFRNKLRLRASVESSDVEITPITLVGVAGRWVNLSVIEFDGHKWVFMSGNNVSEQLLHHPDCGCLVTE